MDELIIVYTTTGDKAVAEAIANHLVQSDLVVCAQIDQIHSVFKWNGVINNAQEFRLCLKLPSDNYQKTEDAIMDMHNYDLPEIIKVNIGGGYKPYLEWLSGKV